jgi:hypothetical protein
MVLALTFALATAALSPPQAGTASSQGSVKRVCEFEEQAVSRASRAVCRTVRETKPVKGAKAADEKLQVQERDVRTGDAQQQDVQQRVVPERTSASNNTTAVKLNSSASATALPASANGNGTEVAKEKKVCRAEKSAISRMPTRVCRTVTEWTRHDIDFQKLEQIASKKGSQ